MRGSGPDDRRGNRQDARCQRQPERDDAMPDKDELEFKGTLEPERGAYPVVVTRWIPAVYGVKPVRFVPVPLHSPDREAFVLVEPHPYEDGLLTAACLAKLVEAVVKESRKSGFKMCIVLAAERAIYVDPDGRTHESRSPPGGGLRFDAKKAAAKNRGSAKPGKDGAR